MYNCLYYFNNFIKYCVTKGVETDPQGLLKTITGRVEN